nr:hypothetical protein [Bradyrhizobium sp. CCBAU 51765]
MPKTLGGALPELKPVNIGAAVIDIRSKMHMAAVDPGRTDTPVRAFGTFTQGLHELTDWLKACGIISVAMESTGSIGSPSTRFSSREGSTSFWSTHVTPRTCLDAELMSVTPLGCGSFIPTVCCAAASGLMPISRRYAPISVSESG